MVLSLTTIDTFDSVVLTLLSAIEAKDLKLRRHSERVAKYAACIAEMSGLGAAACEQIHYGALLHDIGNLGIPDSILLKPSGLSKWELEEMKLHPIIGEQICKSLLSVKPLRPLIRSHHEKLDGSGYPDGLCGDEIPRFVRILSVADVYDSLRSDRAYRSAYNHEEALEILVEEAARGWWDLKAIELLGGITVPEGDFAPV